MDAEVVAKESVVRRRHGRCSSPGRVNGAAVTLAGACQAFQLCHAAAIVIVIVIVIAVVATAAAAVVVVVVATVRDLVFSTVSPF